MIFGFGKRRREEIEDEEPEIELILFQGAMNGQEANLKENAKLVQAGLLPAKELVTDAILRRADRIRLEPKGKVAIVALSIDGINYPGGRMSTQQALAVTQMIKLLAGLDIKERKKTQQGGINAELQGTKWELRVTSVGVPEGGERLTILPRNPKVHRVTPDDLGFASELKDKIREKMTNRSGIIITAGPPFSGTTTTSVGVLRSVDAYVYGIYSLYDAEGRDLGNVSPFEPNEGDDLDATITRLVRMESDIVFLPPLRDAETAKTMFARQGEIGMMCEMPARDAAGAVVQLVQWVGKDAVAEGLRGVVGQKLIRLLCTTCREAFRPNPKLVQQVGLPPETRLLYRQARPPQPGERGEEPPPPCEVCGGVGYLGQTGMYEMIEMTDGMKQVIAAGGDAAAIRTQARKEKMPNLQQDGLRLAAEGKTSLEELKRVFKAAQ